MKAKPRKWFVLPSGDDVNSVISINFPDATFQEEIHVTVNDKTQTKPAWEVSLETIEQLLNFLRTSRIDGKLLVAVKIDDGEVHMAQRHEFDKKAKKIKDRTAETKGAIKGKRGTTFIAVPGSRSVPSAKTSSRSKK